MILKVFPPLKTAMNYLLESLSSKLEYKFKTELMKGICSSVTGMGMMVKMSLLAKCKMTALSFYMIFAMTMSIIFSFS